MSTRSPSRGFTLVELLVVIAIIMLLTSVVLGTVTEARNRARIASTKATLHSIQTAFEMYFSNHGDYPGILNHCDICNMATGPGAYDYSEWAQGTWDDIVNAVSSEKLINNQILLDPWGRRYGYDNNYRQPCWGGYTIVCSAGPNGYLETDICQGAAAASGGDDICVFFPDND